MTSNNMIRHAIDHAIGPNGSTDDPSAPTLAIGEDDFAFAAMVQIYELLVASTQNEQNMTLLIDMARHQFGADLFKGLDVDAAFAEAKEGFHKIRAATQRLAAAYQGETP